MCVEFRCEYCDTPIQRRIGSAGRQRKYCKPSCGVSRRKLLERDNRLCKMKFMNPEIIEELRKLTNCQICGRSADDNITLSKRKRSLCLDHDHKTGKLRGVLCDRCNRGIGLLKDDIRILKSAISYLEKFLTEIDDVR